MPPAVNHNPKHASMIFDYPDAQVVHKDPLLCSIDNFVTDKEAAHLIDSAKDKLAQALVSSAKSGVKSAGRTGMNCWLPHTQDPTVKALVQRVCDLVKLPASHAESVQMIYYGETQEYRPHFDAWDPNTDRGQRCMSKGGQRILTCLMYLNTPEKGGGTTFPKIDTQVDAQKGRIVIFHNCHKNTIERHPHSLHGGMPVLSGEKWACNLWFRDLSLRPG